MVSKEDTSDSDNDAQFQSDEDKKSLADEDPAPNMLCDNEKIKIAKNFHNCLYMALLNFNVNEQTVLNFKNRFNNSITTHHSDSKNVEHTSEDDYILQIMNSNTFKKSLNNLMVSYIKHHQAVLIFVIKVETFFLPIVFMKVCISMFYHVFITFACLSSKEKSLALILGEYEVCALTELLVFAVAGQALINESENLYDDLMKSPWYICDVKFQKLFYMVLIRSGRVNRVSVGKLTNLSLPTFLSIMKTALSYLAVLRQVVE
ncbi:hypothetical protein RN001_004272 [Aquatica leii]|uniref:Uncharacterized protein n=1 Tax=Aquatica leii TaxID=1421715 RepID=A0AAN7QJF8_9COLE|nr:hypothetical protein RN001_004272 [Aquatica leii]